MIKGRGYHTESLQLRGFVDSAFGLVASSPDSTSKKEIARSVTIFFFKKKRLTFPYIEQWGINRSDNGC